MTQRHHRRRRHPKFLMAYCLAVALGGFFVSVYAQPAAPAKTEENEKNTSADELLDLPSFNPKKKVTPKAPVTLELLPEHMPETQQAEQYGPPPPPATPQPELAQETQSQPEAEPEPTVTASADPVPAQETPPPAEAEMMGPPAPEIAAAETTETTAQEEAYGPPAPPPADTVAAAETAPAAPEQQPEQQAEMMGPPAPGTSPADPSPAGDPPVQTAAAQLAPTDPAKDIIQDGWKEGSLMFSAAELQKLREALLAPPSVPGTETATATPTGPGPAPDVPTDGSAPPATPVVDYAAFYVNSILYHGKDQWSVWMNGRKFFPGRDSPLERVTMEEVTDDRVSFRWKPANRLKLPQEFDEKHVHLEADGTILITLATNQTLLTEKLMVLEGRALTREIRNLIAANTAKAQLASTPLATATPTAPAVSVENGAPAALAPVTPPPAAPPPLPDNRERDNVDQLISKYREAEIKNAQPKSIGAAP